MDKAYQEACREGSTCSHRAIIELVGHRGGGKSTLLNRLTGNPFDDDINSTEGISTHLVTSSFGSRKKIRAWKETKTDEVVHFKDFKNVVTSKAKEISEEARKGTSSKQIPQKPVQQMAPSKLVETHMKQSTHSDDNTDDPLE